MRLYKDETVGMENMPSIVVGCNEVGAGGNLGFGLPRIISEP